MLNYGAHGMAQDHAAALKYFTWAALAGDEVAMAHLGHMFASGQGTEKDLAAAQGWFEKGARAGHPSAMFGLGYMHFSGQGVPQDYEKAFKFFMQAAEGGVPDAFFYLGVIHVRGLGLRRRNAQRAFSYFMLAAHAGHLQALYNTAMMHLSGKGTARACKPAAYLLKQIAERGRASAVLQQGHQYFFKGRYTQALLTYLQAAEMGIELGQSNAAWILEKSYRHTGQAAAATALLLSKRSAQQGNVQSLINMGDAYFYGAGVEQDWVRSAAIYYDAYQERSAEAMFNLGFMHEFGAGVPKDLQLARRFYNMASHTMKDAAVAVHIANAWLGLHELLERLQPWLPRWLDSIWDRIFRLEPPQTNLFGLRDFLQSLAPKELPLYSESLIWQLKRLWVAVASHFDELGEVGHEMAETSTLLLLLLILYVVFKLKRGRATRQQR